MADINYTEYKSDNELLKIISENGTGGGVPKSYVDTADALKVNKAGDTMTGQLVINNTSTNGSQRIQQTGDTSGHGLRILSSGSSGSINLWSDASGYARISSSSNESAGLLLNGGGNGSVGINVTSILNTRSLTTGQPVRFQDVDYIAGTGFPNGVVSAPVGSTYIDTNATNGAIEWKKATGTGNTGWVVSVGDTGWRSLSTVLENGWAGLIYIRRIDNIVCVSAGRYSFTGADATSDAFYTLPDGFRSYGPGNFSFLGVAGLGSAVPAMGLVGITRHTFLLTSSARTQVAGEWSYATQNAWPSTLPGTAA